MVVYFCNGWRIEGGLNTCGSSNVVHACSGLLPALLRYVTSADHVSGRRSHVPTSEARSRSVDVELC